MHREESNNTALPERNTESKLAAGRRKFGQDSQSSHSLSAAQDSDE